MTIFSYTLSIHNQFIDVVIRCESESFTEHCLYFQILGIVYGKSLMHKIRIKSETSNQNMNDDEHIHRAMCVLGSCVYMCVLMLGIGEAIIIISIIQCVHVIENTLAVGTIAFLLDWHRLFDSTVNCKKRHFREGKGYKRNSMQHVSTQTKRRCTERKKKRAAAQ